MEDGGTEEDRLSHEIVGAAIEVHRHLGPGLLESTYETCLARELAVRGLHFEKQKPLPVEYKGVKLDAGYRLDLLVENRVVVEIKSVDRLTGLHQAQVLSYLKVGGYRLGMLLNFNVEVLREGIRRVVLN
ncbi:MAG TPA: GxxExxY protein, partial [Planctomycetota bacterium]|nr:GxxExxY protein [Planctomycetota bacterium]